MADVKPVVKISSSTIHIDQVMAVGVAMRGSCWTNRRHFAASLTPVSNFSIG